MDYFLLQETTTMTLPADTPDAIDKAAYHAFYAFFLALAILLNIVIAAVIVYNLFMDKPARRMRPTAKQVAVTASPDRGVRCPAKLGAILACCVVQLLSAVFPYSLTLHVSLARDSQIPAPCYSVVTAVVGTSVLDALTLLVLAVLTMAETFSRGFLVMATKKTQVMYVVAMLMLSVLYSVIVVIPAFFTLWLQDRDNPCSASRNEMLELNPSTHSTSRRVLPAAKFLLPFLLLMTAQFLLKLTEFARPKYSLVESNNNNNNNNNNSDQTQTAFTDKTTTDTKVAETNYGQQGHTGSLPRSSTLQRSGPREAAVVEENNDNNSKNKTRTVKCDDTLEHDIYTALLPPDKSTTTSTAPSATGTATKQIFSVALNLRLAGLSASTLYFLDFFLMFAFWDLLGTHDSMDVVYARLKAASDFLKMLVLVVVPCCWMADKEIRAGFCRMLRRGRA